MGFNFLPTRNAVFKVHAGKSYRVPSAYELGAYGLHRHEGRFEKGNVNNEPEQAWQLDLGYEKKWNTLKLSVSPFLNYFTNYLFLNPTPDLRTEGQIYEYQQANALLLGGETSLDYYIIPQINMTLGAEYVYAVNLDLMGALPFTPPFNVQTGINYLFDENKIIGKSKIGLELVSVAPQKYTVPNELTTPGYGCLNLHAASEIKIGSQRISIVFNVKNILDTKYYNHISFYRRLRIPEPGRDFQLFISIPIK
jgi:iron complex outermembrane receptor protein